MAVWKRSRCRFPLQRFIDLNLSELTSLPVDIYLSGTYPTALCQGLLSILAGMARMGLGGFPGKCCGVFPQLSPSPPEETI